VPGPRRPAPAATQSFRYLIGETSGVRGSSTSSVQFRTSFLKACRTMTEGIKIYLVSGLTTARLKFD
jgi:hypothetical protein